MANRVDEIIKVHMAKSLFFFQKPAITTRFECCIPFFERINTSRDIRLQTRQKLGF